MGGFTTSSNRNSEVFIRIVGTKDKEAVVDFLHKFFENDEPLNATLKVVYEDYSMVDNGLGLMAVINSDLVGVCYNVIIDRDYPNISQVCGPDDTAGFLFEYVAKSARLFDKYPNSEKALKIMALATHREYRKMGIGTQLINASRVIAKAQACGFITADCSSYYSAKGMEKLGFVRHYTLAYSDFKINGEIAFKPEPPHQSINVYTLAL